MSQKIGQLKLVTISEEMKKAYLDYAMSVIVARALPDIRDGLKPVHRRILYAMQGMNLTSSSKYTKSAKIVGECFVKDTLVLTTQGLLPIQKIKINNQVYTQNGIKKVTQLYEMPKKALLKINLENGLSNTATSSQKFRVLTPEWKLIWKKAKNLNKNDFVALRTTYPNITNLIQLKKISHNQPTYLNKNVAYLLGIFAADGWISKEYGAKKLPRISFTAGNSQEVAERIVYIFKKEFHYQPTIEEAKTGICYRIRINRKIINQFFTSNFPLENQKAPTKRIPPQIFNSPKDIVFSFISGLIDGDGYVSAKRNLIQYGSISEDLVSQLQVLLHYLGIFSTKYFQKKSAPTHHDSYSLEIRGKEATKLIARLDLAEKNKRTRASSKKISPESGWNKYEIIPYAGKMLFMELSTKHLGAGWYQDKNGHKFRSGIKYSNGNKIKYSSNLHTKPLRRNQIVEWGIKDKLERIGSPQSKFLDCVLEDKIYFTKIASIEKSPLERTYDIQVEDAHQFTANGMIVHNCMGKYHPHGDMAIYDTLVRLAQDFSMRYPLIDGQGNFGSVDGDPAAAMRYSEARLAKISQEMLTDLDKETVDFIDNFDATTQEPVFLPAKLPNLLLMGSDGIAVGMATKIPPHNLKEVIDGLVHMISQGKTVLPTRRTSRFEIKKIQLETTKGTSLKNEDLQKTIKLALKTSFTSNVNIEDLIKFIKGPDFPTGALIYDQKEILQAYTTGKGKIIVRAKAEITETEGGKFQIIVHEIPYQVNKSKLVAKIAHLIKEKKIIGVSDLRDESDRQGLRIVLDLKKTSRPKVILNNLFKHTPLQTSYPANMVALVNGTPQTLNLKQILVEFIKHRQKVVTKKTIFELKAAKHRAHILEGLKIALDNLDEVIATIRKSETVDSARMNLIKKFGLSKVQADAILEMQLRRLAALERKKIEDEYKDVCRQIEYLTGLLAKPQKILKIIKDELLELKEKYGDSRRTKIYQRPPGDFSEEDLVPQEKCLIIMTKSGYVKRLPTGTYRSQRRGGKGVTGMATKETDEILHFLTAETHDNLLFFTNKGRVFSIRTWEVPEGSRQSKGQAVINLINITQDEKIQAILNLKEDVGQIKNKFLFMVTKRGVVKKTAMEKFANIRSSGLIAIKLRSSDELCWVKETNGKKHILLIAHNGKSIRFDENDARPMGRDTTGIRGIRLKPNDYIVGMEIFDAQPNPPKDKRRQFFQDVLVIMENGLGKRTTLSGHPRQKRGGIGVKAANVTKKTGKIIASHLVNQNIKQVILTSKKAQVIKLPLKNIPRLGRDTQGVILMRFSKPNDMIAAVACLKK